MTLQQIQEAVGRKCTLTDGSGNFIDGLVSAEDIRHLANIRWSQLHSKFSNKFPEQLELGVSINLVAGQENYEIIETGQEGITINYVGVKYSSTDDYFTRARSRRFTSLHKYDTDTTKFVDSVPYYTTAASKQTVESPSLQGSIRQAIKLRPVPAENITAGLFIRLVENPELMAQSTDTPYTLPNDDAHSLIVGYVIADVWEMKRDWANSNEAINRAIMEESNFFANYQPSSSDEPLRMSPGKVYNPYQGR